MESNYLLLIENEKVLDFAFEDKRDFCQRQRSVVFQKSCLKRKYFILPSLATKTYYFYIKQNAYRNITELS